MKFSNLFKWGGGGKTYDVHANDIAPGNYTTSPGPGMANVPFDVNAYNAQKQAELARANRMTGQQKNLVRIGQVATIAGFGAGALPAAGGASTGAATGAFGTGAGTGIGGGAMVGAGGTGASVAGASAAGGGVPWMRIAELGAGLYSNYKGQKAQTKANDQEFAYRTAADERTNAMLTANEAQRQKEWAAQQIMLEKQWAAEQEQQRLDRLEEARQNALAERYRADQEAARAPYRQAGQIALRDLVGGLRTSGMR